MQILIVGSGGREHAIAWKISQSPRVSRLFIAPGNPGTATLGENVALSAEDVPGLVAFAVQHAIELVVIGPESALAAGLADALQAVGIPVFGPTRAAAQIETSKAFAKEFMLRHGIPSARFACFEQLEPALAYLAHVTWPVVIKTSGLAAGKGVILPDSAAEAQAALRAMLVERQYGAAGEQVIIEERLTGEEVSLLAFSDGHTIYPMPPAQDHKRLLDGDHGPNTGGMGAYAPAPALTPELADVAMRKILQPAIAGLRQEGMPFVGVLYAGLMLTPSGPQALEFNCRFGDPETQVQLPLLDTDLVDICEACVQGRLAELTLRWKEAAAACVVLASEGYPAHPVTGLPISGLDAPGSPGALIFQAGTRRQEDHILTAGGRVLTVTGTGPNLEAALAAAYTALRPLHFKGMHYRRDIGQRALQPAAPAPSAYAASGVNIDAGNRAVEMMRAAVHSTYTPAVLAGIGAFGGLFDAQALSSLRSPVLVASTDGVGTKVRLGAAANRTESLGMDIVNHCINDILVQGARPLFFLDYFATARLDPHVIASLVSGIASACRAAGCVLLGGETAEMPGVYVSGEFDLAGTIVGCVERERILPRADLQAGDLLIGLRSSGPHTNGYSLIRRVFANIPLDTVYPELGCTLADALLAPHRSYLPLLVPILDQDPSPVKALAHLTGGGFIENIPRVLPAGLRAVIHTGSWPVPPLFRLIEQVGQIAAEEMFRVFNLGIGMVAIVAPAQRTAFQQAIPEETWVIGELVAGEKGVALR